jgi:NAD(P)-dependent dehydrogenase (short-subunit alcohol dehydrogenase family)
LVPADIEEAPLLESSLEKVRRPIDTNFVRVVRLMQIGRGMPARRHRVQGSQTAFADRENCAVCAAAKAAVSQLTQAAAVEWGPYGARVVCLAPNAR